MKAVRTVLRGFFFALALVAALRAAAADPDPPWLRDLLETHRRGMNAPALAAGIATEAGVVAASMVGVRRAGDTLAAQQSDRIHLGSIAKPVSVTLLARFIEQGFLRWDTSLEQMFPALLETMQPAYRTVTIAQLVSHTSGMPYQPRTPEQITDREGTTARFRRLGYVKAALRDAPEAPPGTKVIYSGGHVIAAYYLETLMGEDFEALLREQVFRPLGISTARFGAPATPGTVDGLWEHVMEGGRIRRVPPPDDQAVQARSPVGRNLCMSIGDLTRFAAMHLQGARGRSDFLKPATFRRLNTPLAPLGASLGWGIGRAAWARGPVFWHSGSTGRNFALCHIVPEENLAICVATNLAYKGMHERLDALTQAIAREVRAGRLRVR